MAPKPGHCTTATLCSMQGGANTVMQRAHRTPRTPARMPLVETPLGQGKPNQATR